MLILEEKLFFLVSQYQTLIYAIYNNIDWIIKLQKWCIQVVTYSEFTEHTGPLFSELKLLKIKDIFSSTKLLFMFDFINENVPEELETIFVVNRLMHSYETRSSMVFHLPRQFKTAITWKLTFPPADSQWAIFEKSTKII